MISKCAKGKLVLKLCKMMKWDNSIAWKIWCCPLRKDHLEEIINKLTANTRRTQ